MDDSFSLGKFLFIHRKMLFISLIIGTFLGFSATFFIPKKYLSTAIIYPVNSYSQDQLISNPQFGMEIETEQLLQLLESKTMRDKTIQKFDLYTYYNLDSTLPESRDKIDLKYIADVNFMRSKYLSIVINVKTKSPELSAAIANFQITEVDAYKTAIFQQNRETEFHNIEQKYFKNKAYLKQLQDSIYSIKSDKKQLIFNYIENLNNENFNSETFVNDPKLEPLINDYLFAFNENRLLKDNYLKMKDILYKPLPSVYSIDKAVPSYKKSSPSYGVNIIIGALLTTFLVFVTKLFLLKWSELKKEFG